MTADMTLTLPMTLIDVPKGRARSLDAAWVESLAVLIGSQGLMHPIRVRAVGERFELVSGLRRYCAAELLGWVSIPYTLSTAETADDARLEEVMENLGREALIALDRCHSLYELKQVWERKYPETAQGGDRKSKATKIKMQTLHFDQEQQEIFGFAQSNAERIGLSKRSIFLAVAIWEKLSPASRDRLVGTALAYKQTELKALSELSHKLQGQVLDLVLGDDDVTNVSGALQALEGGVVPDPIEKQLTALRKTVSKLPEPVFDRLILENEERVIAALKRQGRI
ncbi:MAG: ParB/RepB/Spo0J family partition protein [Thalassovita sp.]